MKYSVKIISKTDFSDFENELEGLGEFEPLGTPFSHNGAITLVVLLPKNPIPKNTQKTEDK